MSVLITISIPITEWIDRWQGKWNASHAYEADQLVEYQGGIYVALKSSTDIPPEAEVTSEYWQLISTGIL
jgi:hypothetical protein